MNRLQEDINQYIDSAKRQLDLISSADTALEMQELLAARAQRSFADDMERLVNSPRQFSALQIVSHLRHQAMVSVSNYWPSGNISVTAVEEHLFVEVRKSFLNNANFNHVPALSNGLQLSDDDILGVM